MSVSIIVSSSRVISISSSDTSGIITIIIVSIVSAIGSVGIPCNSYMYVCSLAPQGNESNSGQQYRGQGAFFGHYWYVKKWQPFLVGVSRQGASGGQWWPNRNSSESTNPE